MAKAYDCTEWSFLRHMLLALGFDARWVELIMFYVTTVSYSFLVNGSRIGPVKPSRVLRQGNPLSPYLFIICADGLSLLLQKAQSGGSIHGCRANVQEAGEVKRCLFVYESLSRLVVNFHKSSICFSKNTREETREEVALVLGVVQAPNFGKYLGLPSFVGRNKKETFSYIEDKIRQRIRSLSKKLLSQAGKEIMLKSVV
ncbi:PREDICTED: uncharacterized protein LOC109157753 [Ipomoea nil]|uniref:uncharacterized protein LOC109157753 n=1 Tax=Ipomoea nil TaxID=35883 RepID=UPI000901691D|nr:PREDICTED: uncharacterized protein LOC109157753 [Ipomoea nil]